MTDTLTPTEPTAVVEYTNADDLLAASFEQTMKVRTLHPYDADELDQATAVIEQYAPNGSLTERVAIALIDAAKSYAWEASVPLSRAAKMVQKAWQELTVSPETSIGRVTLSLDEPDALDPVVCFVSLRTGMRLFQPGKVEAMAIAYYPQNTREVQDRQTGEYNVLASWFDTTGYSHVITTFADCEDAEQAALDLRRAVAFSEKCRTLDGMTEDEVREAVRREVYPRQPRTSVL